MNKYERIASRIIDRVSDVVEAQHPELNLNTEIAKESNIDNPAVICGVAYYDLEVEVAEMIKKFLFDQEVSKIKLKLIYKKQSKEVNEVLDENEKENIMIYKIFDMGDKNYNEWYGTQDDIIKYLKEQNNLKDDESWIENLEDYGLTFEMIYEVEK